MKIFITGGTGFIGSWVVKALSDLGHETVILARNPEKVPALHDLPGVSIHKGMMGDYDIIENLLRDCDACIHVALWWGDSAVEMIQHEATSSVKLFELCGQLGIKKLIYTSSTAAQGKVYPCMVESMRPEPIDYYGATKASSEMFLSAVNRVYPDMQCNVVRPGYTYGNPVVVGGSIQSDKRIKDIVKAALKGETIILEKNGGTQFISAEDLAKVYLGVLDSDVSGEIFYGLGVPFIRWSDIAEEAIRQTNSKSKVQFEGGGDGDPWIFDLKKIEKYFGLSFDGWPGMVEHVRYLVNLYSE